MTEPAKSGQAASDWNSEVPTGHLRWQRGVLQQRWKIVTMRGVSPVRKDTVWRDVPVAPEDADDADG